MLPNNYPRPYPRQQGYTGIIKNSGGNIQIELLSATDNTIGNEGYKLSVTSKAVTISANKPAGLFYGMQTLLQLLPPSIESKTAVANTSWTIPCVEITDEPRFRMARYDVRC
jgi:hexosaminidase